jgi:ribose transport system permease protein
MPYVYVLLLGGAIVGMQPNLIYGPGAIEARFALVVPLALVAFGQTLVLLTRGIDLSVGGLISVVSALLATHLSRGGTLLIGEVALMALLGVAVGALNGLVIKVTRIQPFIVTLATWSIWGGTAFAILPIEGGTPPPGLTAAVSGAFLGVPKGLIITAALFVCWIWVKPTRFVTDLVAIGSDEDRARLMGVRVGWRKTQAYALSGLLAALASVWVTGQTGAGAPNGGDQFILASIAAVVLGGTSIFGGKGSGASSVAGAITYLMIPDLIFSLNLTSFWSTFFQGFVLIVAVVLNSLVQRRGRGRR